VAAAPVDITVLLQQWRAGDREAESRLFELLMPELRKIAQRCLRRERRDHTLQRTELVNEAFMKLAKAKNIDWRDRGHFFAIVTIKMRRFLIEYARRRPKAQLLSISHAAAWDTRYCRIASGAFTPVLAKHTKSFNLIDTLSVGVDRIQRNFVPPQHIDGLGGAVVKLSSIWLMGAIPV